MKRVITLLFTICITSLTSLASELESFDVEKSTREKIQRVGNIERDINKRIYAYKGEWITGITASYLTFSADDADYLLFVDGIDADFAMTTINPYVGYLYRHNHAVGMRLGYSFMNGTLNSARLDLGEESGVQIEIPYIHSSSRYYTGSIFHRSYAALDEKGHFGLFAELELGATGGYTIFEYGSGDERVYYRSEKRSVDLSFNPGMSVFVMSNVSTSLSFAFGGIDYKIIKQYDEAGNYIGRHEDSGMNFKFNFLAINIGITVHIWKSNE